ncbi:MAG: class I SAM-dependent methyltransferase [Bacteroidales bacterium]|nr:class I SAM-dependent methyltransferase [Bacteroidales bacterium]
MILKEINKKLLILPEDTASPIKTLEAKFIYHFLLKKKITTTLETGFAYAKSASHIIAATKSKHIAIDPFQKNYKDLGLKNIKSLDFDKYLTFYNDYSHNILPQLVKENSQFEFIFIDGDHKFDGEFVDFYYADLLLKNNGYILLHDTWMRSTRLLMSFINSNRKDYKYIKTPLRNFALYQKNGEDSRNGMHFKEFYTFKSFLTFNIIMWLTTGKDNFIKRIVYKIKEKLK